MLIDSTRRKLKVPPKFLPYMEKNHIYELFHELACELLIQRPDDHVLFMKKVINHAAMVRNARRIIIISPPYIDKTSLAVELGTILKLNVICAETIKKALRKHRHSKLSPQWLLAKIIRQKMQKLHDDCNLGWILIDYPRNHQEACSFNRTGILPTHVFQLIPPFASPLQQLHRKDIPVEWKKYRETLPGLRAAYQNRWQEINMGGRSNEKIIALCQQLVEHTKHCGAPMLPRVCLIGPKGSGCKTIAKMLVERFKLVHVHFPDLVAEVMETDSEESKALHVVGAPLDVQTEMYAQILEKKLLENICAEDVQGWVLTGYPMVLQDMKNLDMFPTPPNRVIFIDCPMNICRYRLVNRKVNAYTGSVTNIANFPLYESTQTKLNIHPKDWNEPVDNLLKHYANVSPVLKKYCAGTASVINGQQVIATVLQCVEDCIIKPAPDAPPRDPQGLYDDAECLCKAESCIYKHFHKNIA